MNISVDSGEADDDEVQVIDADGSPYTNQLRRRSNPIKRDGRNQRPPSRDEVQILVPGNGSVRPRPARFLSSSAYTPRQSSSFIPKSEIVVRGTASSQQRKRVDHPHAKQTMPGIKAPPGHRAREFTNSNVTRDPTGKYHLKLAENNKKRASDPINVDLEDEPPKKIQVLVRDNNQTSRHFAPLDTSFSKPVRHKDPIDRALEERGLLAKKSHEDSFAQGFDRKPSMQDDILNSLKFAARKPADGNRPRGLVQPIHSESRFPQRTEEYRNPEIKFSLMWGNFNGSVHHNVVVSVNHDGYIDFHENGMLIATLKRDDVVSVKCTPDGKKWHFDADPGLLRVVDQFNIVEDNYLLVVVDRHAKAAGEALSKVFGSITDRMELFDFDKKYLTGTRRPSEGRGTSRRESDVVPGDRAKASSLLQRSKSTDTTVREVTRRGPLETHTPKSETARRQSDVLKPRNSLTDGDSLPSRTPATGTRRETRSQAALRKNEVLLTYPLNAVKNKITIYQEDYDRLNDDEFLNDTIIEFYLTYVLENLPPEIRQVTHVFNTFFWTNLIRKNANGKRGHENVKKWTSKFDLFTKKYVVIPVNEAAHWYVAIICNLDKAKARTETPKTSKPRTRSQIDEPSPEPMDVDDEVFQVANESTMEVLDDPAMTVTDEPIVEVERPETDVSLICVVDKELPPPPKVVIEVSPKLSHEIIQLDNGEENTMDHEFRRLSLSNDLKASYDHRSDPAISLEDQLAIAAAMKADAGPVTRRSGVPRSEDPVNDVARPSTVTSMLRKKYHVEAEENTESLSSPPTPPPTNRRISGKPVPINEPVIIIFDSLGLKHNQTFKTLRDYLADEAKAKRGIDISREEIHGLHAKVPGQSNYCDCGVFLLHYVERFLHDPERYLPDILNRVHDSSEPALTQELWGSGEVRNKRKQIQSLIVTLSIASNEAALSKEATDKKSSETPKPEDVQKKGDDEKKGDGEKKDKEEREEVHEEEQEEGKDQKPIEEQMKDSQSDITRAGSRHITRRKKPLHPTRRAPEDKSGVIEIE